MKYLSPPLWAKGRYTVIEPFTVSPTMIYQCIELRDFEGIFASGDKVYEEYYEPLEIPESKYRADLKDDAVIVTLVDIDGNMLYIPSSYIRSFPNTGDVPYKHLVISCSLGAVPDYLDLATLTEVMQTAVLETVGVANSKVNIASAPARNAISPSEHDALEAARTASITYTETYKSKYLKAETEKVKLQEKVLVLTQMLIDAGIIT